MKGLILSDKFLKLNFLAFFYIILLITYTEDLRSMPVSSPTPIHVLLLGASVGNQWDFPNLPSRFHQNNFKFEFIAKYEPDKSDLLHTVLSRKADRPDILIIKQCAAYIRSDISEYDPSFVHNYKKLAVTWVKEIKSAGINPVLATIVPITEALPLNVKIKRFIKKYILRRNISTEYREVRLAGITDYNDWVVDYAKVNDIAVLDLEKALRISDINRYLNPEYTTDGLHLNSKAYNILDKLAIETISEISQN